VEALGIKLTQKNNAFDWKLCNTKTVIPKYETSQFIMAKPTVDRKIDKTSQILGKPLSSIWSQKLNIQIQ